MSLSSVGGRPIARRIPLTLLSCQNGGRYVQPLMGTASTLSKQLATLGVHLSPLPEEPQDNQPGDDWIRRGQAYADVVRLWRAQLKNSAESTRLVVRQLLSHLADTRGLTGWELWLATDLLAELSGRDDRNACPLTAVAQDNIIMSSAQLLGAILSVTGEDPWVFASKTSQYLLGRVDVTPEDSPVVLSLIIESTCKSESLASSDAKDPAQWLAMAQLHTAMVCSLNVATQGFAQGGTGNHLREDRQQLLERLSTSLEVHQASQPASPCSQRLLSLEVETARQLIQHGRRQEGVRMMENVATQSDLDTPAGANVGAWKQILINAATSLKGDAFKLTLIESKSLPRSGHHYLKDVLQDTFQGHFTYCERYHEPGCCKSFPCNAEPYWHQARIQGKPHLRLIKSHDFQLDDPVYPTPPGLIRLVQVRQPFDLLCSYLELAQLNLNEDLLRSHGISLQRLCLYHEKDLLETAYSLIDDHGLVMHPEDTSAWIEQQTGYILGFTQKWMPLCRSLADIGDHHHGTYLLRYEELGGVVETFLHFVYSGSRVELQGENATSFTPRSNSVMNRSSKLISRLLHDHFERISSAEQLILKAWERFPILNGYSQSMIDPSPYGNLPFTQGLGREPQGVRREVAIGKTFRLTSAPSGFESTGVVKRSTSFFFHTEFADGQAITIDLETSMQLDLLVITNRGDACPDRAKSLFCCVHEDPADYTLNLIPIDTDPEFVATPGCQATISLGGVRGRYITIYSRATTALHFSAIEVYVA